MAPHGRPSWPEDGAGGYELEDDEDLLRSQVAERRLRRCEAELARQQRFEQQSLAEVSEVVVPDVRNGLCRQPLASEVQLGFRIDSFVDHGCAGSADESEMTSHARQPASRARGSRRGAVPRRNAPAQGRSHRERRVVAEEAAEAEEELDGFVPLENVQPPQYETMPLKPGVSLDENGRQRAGKAALISKPWEVDSSSLEQDREARLSLADRLEEMAEGLPAPAPALAAATATLARLPAASDGDTAGLPPLAARTRPLGGTSSLPVLQAPVAPALDVRWRQRFRTLGFQTGGRARVPTSGSQAYKQHSFRMIRAQPPVGATMGHGLIRLEQ